MGDDDDRVLGLELLHQVLDAKRRHRVEGGAGLVHEDDVGLGGDGPGDAEALLLTTRQLGGRRLEPVLEGPPSTEPGGATATPNEPALSATLDASGATFPKGFYEVAIAG